MLERVLGCRLLSVSMVLAQDLRADRQRALESTRGEPAKDAATRAKVNVGAWPGDGGQGALIQPE